MPKKPRTRDGEPPSPTAAPLLRQVRHLGQAVLRLEGRGAVVAAGGGEARLRYWTVMASLDRASLNALLRALEIDRPDVISRIARLSADDPELIRQAPPVLRSALQRLRLRAIIDGSEGRTRSQQGQSQDPEWLALGQQ